MTTDPNTAPTPLDAIQAFTIENQEVTAAFLALLNDRARSISRPLRLGVGPDTDAAAVQLCYMGEITWREMMGGSLAEADQRMLETFAAAVQHIVDLNLVQAIVTPAVRVSGNMTSLNVRRFSGVHVLPAEGVEPSEVTRNFLAMLPPTTDMMVLAPAFDAIIHKVRPIDGDLVLLAFKDLIPARQLRAFRNHLADHAKREHERTGKTVHYLALDADLDVHLFRPEDREAVKAALARALSPELDTTPVTFNGRAMEAKIGRLDYSDAVMMFNTVHAEGVREGALYTVTYTNPDGSGGLLAPDLPAVTIVPGMRINMVLTGSA